ncbi:MAG: hypothetical protein IPK68_22140 [Bdellovibrionales bacterium]|nr:hypothetical protein [Bdellovibrionales bacterium]
MKMTGDESPIKRPMRRWQILGREMGAQIELTGKFRPLKFWVVVFTGTRLRTEIASAQIKTAIILAGLLADGDMRLGRDS